ncbi:MAG TPA: S1/P1 nuclease [Pyrinomonadaceae bacterium]
MKLNAAQKYLACLLSVGALIALTSVRAAAWGQEGHAIVARIAAAHLSKKTQTAVVGLLQVDPFFQQKCAQAKTVADKLACIASWADTVRNENGTAALHFVNIPVYAPAAERRYEPARDCKNDQCVVAAIEANLSVLRTSSDAAARAEALKYVVHFLGDIHQPLHNAVDHDADAANAENKAAGHTPVTDRGDRGGNDKLVQWLGEEANAFGCWNLHAVWDEGIIEQKNKNQATYAAALNKPLTAKRLATYQTGDPVAWANDALALAITRAYKLPAPNAQDKVCQVKKKVGDKSVTECDNFTPQVCQQFEVHYRYNLGQSYYKANLPVVEGQLQRAGARLAMLLNGVFDSPTH